MAKLKIKNPSCVAYDILFGCPGWLEGVIQAVETSLTTVGAGSGTLTIVLKH